MYCIYLQHTWSLDRVQVTLYDVMTPLGGCGSIQETKSWFGSSGTLSRVNSNGMVGTVKIEQNMHS